MNGFARMQWAEHYSSDDWQFNFFGWLKGSKANGPSLIYIYKIKFPDSSLSGCKDEQGCKNTSADAVKQSLTQCLLLRFWAAGPEFEAIKRESYLLNKYNAWTYLANLTN